MNTPVSFELAKLLKEKEFDENCRFGYNGAYEPHHLNLIEFGFLQTNSELLKNVYSAPTIADVVMWLYEKHGIWVNVMYLGFEIKYKWDIDIITTSGSHWHSYEEEDNVCFNSPTEAYESAINYTLKNLIKDE